MGPCAKAQGNVPEFPIRYYHLRPTLKRDKFCAKFHFSNVNALSGYVSLLTNETLEVML